MASGTKRPWILDQTPGLDSRDFQELLLDNYVRLTNELQEEGVITHLIQERILSIADKEKIMANTTSHGRAQALVDKLITSGKCSASQFVDVLRRSGHDHLADMLEGKSNSKVARTEGYKDMTSSQFQELNLRLLNVYFEEAIQYKGDADLEEIMGCKMDNVTCSIKVERMAFRKMLTPKGRQIISLVGEDAPGRTVGTVLAADWVGNKTVTSKFNQMYKLDLNKVRKNQTITDAIFDQLLHDSNYEPSFSKEALWRHMEQTQKEILFVLEGLDRLSPFTSPEILQLIDGKLLPRATVVVTVAEANGA
ncbi:uncharacterized protein LOC144873587 [Branchiostoma floridae x Branchiostoma japonicum]